jgi:hypothetical protein
LQCLEGLVDVVGHIDDVGVRELLDDQQQALLVGAQRVADKWLVVFDDGSDVTQRYGLPVDADGPALGLNRDLFELLLRRNRLLVEDVQTLVQRVDETAGAG